MGCSLGSPSDIGAIFLGVQEDLAVENLKFPILLDKRDDDKSIAGQRGPEDGMEHVCSLRHDYVLSSETMWWFCIEGQT